MTTQTLTPRAPAATVVIPSAARNSAGALPAGPRALDNGLARTGSDTRAMMLLAFVAMLLGSLLVLLSGWPINWFRREGDSLP
ncbi:MAG: hypothetical protein LC749_06160 [Actinobacteria bacterium]|nr:hypothetical protein [Actinomycetota bacterium]